MAAGLLDSKKDGVADDSVIGPSMPEPEPVHTEVLNFPPSCSNLPERPLFGTFEISYLWNVAYNDSATSWTFICVNLPMCMHCGQIIHFIS